MDENRQPAIETIRGDELKQRWDQIVEQVTRGTKRVLIEDGGKQLVAVVPARDLARLQELDAQDADDLRALAASRAAFKDVPDEELAREVDRAFREARERYRRTGSEHGGARSR